MALLAALCAVVRGDIARAEPASCACETDRFAIVPFRVVQHFLVEHVSLQHVVAGIAAPRVRLALALDALLRFGVETFWGLFHTAGGARVARYTTQCPILGFLAGLTPLAVGKLSRFEALAAY